MTADRTRLVRRWVHAHEEDRKAGMVFRPADHELPPSRGRTSLDLREDGTLGGAAPGPTDRPEATAGSWELREDDSLLLRDDAGERTYRVVVAEPDRLVLKAVGAP